MRRRGNEAERNGKIIKGQNHFYNLLHLNPIAFVVVNLQGDD